MKIAPYFYENRKKKTKKSMISSKLWKNDTTNCHFIYFCICFLFYIRFYVPEQKILTLNAFNYVV